MLEALMENVVHPILSIANSIIRKELEDKAASHFLRVLFVRYLSEHGRGNILHTFYIGGVRGKIVATITSKIEWKLRELGMWGHNHPCLLNLLLEGWWGDRLFHLGRAVLRSKITETDFESAYPNFLSSLQTPSEDVKNFVETGGKALGKFSLLLLSEEERKQTIFSNWLHRFFKTLEDEIVGLMKLKGLEVESVKVSHMYGGSREMSFHPALVYQPTFLPLVDVSITFNHPRLGKMKVVIPVESSYQHLFTDNPVGFVFDGIFLSPINSFLAASGLSIYLSRASIITRSFGESFFEGSVHTGLEREGLEPETLGKKVAAQLVNDLLEAFPTETNKKPKAFSTLRTISVEEDRLFGEAYFRVIKLSFKVAYGFCALLRMWLARMCSMLPSDIELEILPSMLPVFDAIFHRRIEVRYYVFLKVKRRGDADVAIGTYLGLLSDNDYQNPFKEPAQFWSIKCTLGFSLHFPSGVALNEFLRLPSPAPTKVEYVVENYKNSPRAFGGKMEVTDTRESIKQSFLTFWDALNAFAKEKEQGA